MDTTVNWQELIDKQLNNSARSLLFIRLAKAEQAGLPLAKTLSVLGTDSGAALNARLASFGRAVQAGTDTAQAGLDSGLFL